jgi:CHAT domain-containing protein
LEHWRGRLLLADGDTGSAVASLEAAARAAERVRQTLPSDLLRSAYREDKLGAYQALAGALLSAGNGSQLERAFAVIERAKALALAERISQAPAEAAASPPDDLDQLRAQLNWYYSAYTDRHPESASGDRAALRAAIRQAERDLVEAVMRRDLRAPDPWKTEPTTVSLSEAQARLGPDEALLEYFVVDGEILAVLIRASGAEVRRNLATASAVANLGERLRAHFARYGLQTLYPRRHAAQLRRTTAAYLGQLHQSLVAPLADALPERLIIVPHGALHYIPFHALMEGETPMVERHQVSYAPSAALWAHCRDLPDRGTNSALVIAAGDQRIPHVEKEVVALQSQFAGLPVYAGADATWSRLQQAAPLADVVHVAAHAVFREDNALFSALRLADGWVTVNDLYGLRLRSALVVLTGCETGMSREAPGDELLGLSRAFLAAGAATLVASLWPVHDESAAAWAAEFYGHLRAGRSPAGAVRQAQLALLQAQPDPYYWAPFIAVGRP